MSLHFNATTVLDKKHTFEYHLNRSICLQKLRGKLAYNYLPIVLFTLYTDIYLYIYIYISISGYSTKPWIPFLYVSTSFCAQMFFAGVCKCRIVKRKGNVCKNEEENCLTLI